MAFPTPAAEYLAFQATAVSDYLETVFTGEWKPAVLFEAMNYSLLGSGKRLRPVLCLATAKTFGVDEEQVLPIAAALEMVHCYSLIHDDLPCMDNDDLRRGVPTNHKVYGEDMALLAGDGLLTYAFEQLSTARNVPPERLVQMIRTLSHAAGCFGMVGGQVVDMQMTHVAGTEADLRYIHEHKTAKLIQASVELGGWFVQLTAEKRVALKQYGLNIGMAFQVVDDILDVVGTTEQLGKEAGKDEMLDKLTYPKLIGVRASRELAHKMVHDGVDALRNAGIEAPLLADIGEFVISRTK